MILQVIRYSPVPKEEAGELPPLTTLHAVNDELRLLGLRLIRVEPSTALYDARNTAQDASYDTIPVPVADRRQSYVLVRLDGREIDPPRIYGKLREACKSLFPHENAR